MANRLPRQSQTQGTAGRLQVNQAHTVGTATPVLYQTLNTVLVSCPQYPLLFSGVSKSTYDNLRQYFSNRTVSGGGPVQRVVGLYWSTYVVYFHNHEDAANVVCRDNHVVNDTPLSVFLYDERSRSVYSGRHTVSMQDPRKRSVHAVDVPVVDSEASTTVLVTGIHSSITDDALKSAIDKLDNARRPVQNFMCPWNKGIAFVQFQHHEDAIRVAGMKQVSVSGRFGRRTVNLFLYLGPLRGHTDRPHRTEISTADQHGTDTAPGAPPTSQHDPQPRDARCVSVELQPPDEHTAHGKADTPDVHTAHGKADTPDVHITHGKADTPDEHTAHGKADTPATHVEVEDQRTQAERGPQSHAVYDGQTAQIQSLLQAELGRMEERMKADMKAEIEGEMRAKIKAEMKAENEAKLRAEVARLQTQMENRLHTRLQQEVQQRQKLRSEITNWRSEFGHLQALVSSRVNQLRAEISQPRPEVSELQTQLRSEATEPVNQLRSEVSQLKAQLTSEINQLKSGASEAGPEVNQLRLDVTQLKSQLMSEMNDLKSMFSQATPAVTRLRADVTELQTRTSDVTQSQAQLRSHITREITRTQAQLQSEITQLQAGLQDQLRECRESNAQTKSSLEIRSRMHSRLVSETQTVINEHVTAEIVTLTGTIHTLTNQIAAIQTRLANAASQASGRIEIEEDIAVVANPSRSTSSRPSSDAPS